MKDFLEKYKAVLYVVVAVIGIFGTAFGARAYLDGYCTDLELAEVRAESKCGDIGYQLDKILRDIWEIEARYEPGAPMTNTDRQRLEKLRKALGKWEKYEASWGCEPENA
jgi:hypothetical protein